MDNLIKEYNEWLVKQNVFSMSVGLLNGQMGLCLYWYQQSRIFSNKSYERKADQILEEVLNHIGHFTGVSFEDGLVGILMAINYLIEEKYIDGNVNTIFSDVNDKLFQYGYFRGIDPIEEEDVNIAHLTWICIYFCQLIKKNTLAKEKEYLIKSFIIEGINTIEKAIRDKTFSLKPMTIFRPFSYMLPHLLFLIKEMYTIDLYNYKLDMFCLELSKKIIYNLPTDYGHRYMLLVSIKELSQEMGFVPKGFQEVIKVLSCLIDVKSITNEYRCFDLNLRQGLSGLLFYVHDDIYNSSLLDNFELKIRELVNNCPSGTWKNNRIFNLGDSLTGVFYMYQKLKINHKILINTNENENGI